MAPKVFDATVFEFHSKQQGIALVAGSLTSVVFKDGDDRAANSVVGFVVGVSLAEVEGVGYRFVRNFRRCSAFSSAVRIS